MENISTRNKFIFALILSVVALSVDAVRKAVEVLVKVYITANEALAYLYSVIVALVILAALILLISQKK